MFRSTVILLLSCTAPVLGQAIKQLDPAPQTHPSQAGSTGQSSTGQRSPEQSSTAANYPLDAFPDFSAVMIGSRAELGEGTSRSHIYRSGKQMRMEEPGGSAYFITDLNGGETYGMLEDGCIHDDHPYIRAIPFYIAGKADISVTRAAVGDEIVDGHTCHVEDVTVSSPVLANPKKMRFWEADDLQRFPIKIEFVLPNGHGPIIRYRNVVLGPQDPTLFFHSKSCHSLLQQKTESPAHKPPPQ